MRTIATGLILVLILSTAPAGGERDNPKPARDVEVSGVIIDGLDRPVPGVTVRFYYREGPYSERKEVTLATFTTDNSGRYAGVVHNWPECEWILKLISKGGYGYYGDDVSARDYSGPSRLKDDRFTIWRDMPFEEAVYGLFHLRGDELDQHVLEVLASTVVTFGQLSGKPSIEDVLFANQWRFLTALRKACTNPHVGKSAREFLEFIGELDDPNELQSIKRSTPKIEVAARRLNDAVQAVAETYGFFWEEGEEIYIDKTVFTMNYETALVRCHVHHGALADRGFKLRFEKVKGKWVLRAFVFKWLS